MGRRGRYDDLVTPVEVEANRLHSRGPHVQAPERRSWLGRAPTLEADPALRNARALVEARLFGHDATIRCGRYVLGSLLGEGGMGAVYRARDEDLDRDVAVKIVRVPLDAADKRPFFEEARAAAAVVHPNVVEVYDVGVSDLGIYIAMELVQGVDLRRWTTQRLRSVAEVLDVFRGAGAGLAAAHAAGLVHRDFKPENVLVGDDRPRVADFGLALRMGALFGRRLETR